MILLKETDEGCFISNVKRKNNPKTLEPARKPFIQNTIKSNLLVSLLTMDKQDDENGTETHPKGNTTFS